jgi:hypothetical protein
MGERSQPDRVWFWVAPLLVMVRHSLLCTADYAPLLRAFPA